MLRSLTLVEKLEIERNNIPADGLIPPCPEPPDWMSFEAKMEWLRAAPELHKKGRLVGGLISLLENYCIATGEIRECEAMLASDGKIINGKVHPAFKMMIDAMAIAKSIGGELRFARDGVPDNDRARSNGWDESLLA